MVGHRDANDIIGFGNGLFRQTVAFRSHNDSQVFFVFQARVVERDGLFGKRHGCCLETVLVQTRCGFVQPRPGYQEYTPHGHADGTAVQRVARIFCEQYGVHSKRRCRAEDSADVRRVAHSLDDNDAARILAQRFHVGKLFSPHRTQDASRECVARHLCEQFAASRIYRDSFAALEHLCRVAFDVSAFTQDGEGFISGGECHLDDFGTLGYEDAVFHVQTVAQLCLGQRMKHFHARDVQ